LITSQLAKLQNKFLHFAIEQSISLVERRVKTKYMRSKYADTAAIIFSFFSSIQKDAKKPRRVAFEGQELSNNHAYARLIQKPVKEKRSALRFYNAKD